MRLSLSVIVNGARTAALCAAAAGLFAFGPAVAQPQNAQAQTAPEETFVGDVPYVATPQDVVEAMLNLAKVGPQDYIIDLGSGDGRLVVTAAAKYGAQGFGVDLDPKRIAESLENARKAGVSDRAQFFQRDLFETDFSRATVLTMYLLPDINLQLRPKVLGLKPGTRVVSHDFDMGDWRPDERIRMISKNTGYESNAYLWIVPAQAAGSWRWRDGGDTLTLSVSQTYQAITVSVTGTEVADAKLRGAEMSFTANGRSYRGSINGDVISGTVRDGSGERAWRAERAKQ